MSVNVFLLKMVGSFIGKIAAEKLLKFNNDDRTTYEVELYDIINKTKQDYLNEFPEDDYDIDEKFSFIKSDDLLIGLLEYRLSDNYEMSTISSIIENNNKIKTPTEDQIIFFYNCFKINIESSSILSSLHIKDNFKEEIFFISKKIEDTNLKIDQGFKNIKEDTSLIIALLKEKDKPAYEISIKLIQKSLENFQLLTAKSQLDQLKTKLINDGKLTSELESRILYYLAICERETRNLSVQDSASMFVNSFLLNKKDFKLKEKACVEYLNLQNENQANKIADELLTIDNFNQTAWIVKSIINENIKKFLTEVPGVIRNSTSFNNALSYYLLFNKKIKNLDELDNFNLSIDASSLKDKTLTVFNLSEWTLLIHLQYNIELHSRKERYIHGKLTPLNKNKIINLLLIGLNKLNQSLKGTELEVFNKENTFLLNYYNYRISLDLQYYSVCDEIFQSIKPFSLQIFQMVQMNNSLKKYEKSQGLINSHLESSRNDQDDSSEILIMKITLHQIQNQNTEAIDTFIDYLDNIQELYHPICSNIVMLGSTLFGLSEFQERIEYILNKINNLKTHIQDLPSFLSKYFKIKYSEITEQFKNSFNESIEGYSFLNTREFLYFKMDSYIMLKDLEKAYSSADEYFLQPEFSPEFNLYLDVIYKIILNKESKLDGLTEKLLAGLEFLRINSSKQNNYLLEIEYTIRKKGSQWNIALIISKLLFEEQPSNEKYIAICFESLHRLEQLNEIDLYSSQIPKDFNHESYGLNVANILVLNNINKNIAFDIIYNLALNKEHKQSRLYYFAQSTILREDRFISFPSVEPNSYVTYKIDNIITSEKVDLNHNFIGRKIGEKFKIQRDITLTFHEVEIIECNNEYLNLFREITKEASHPNSNLGIESINFDFDNEGSIQEQFKRLFGQSGDENKKFQKKQFKDYFEYRSSFFLLSKAIFKENAFETYFHLINFKKFNCLPIIYQTNKKSYYDNYVLDFSSLIPIYLFCKSNNFILSKKPIISVLNKQVIKDYLFEKKNEPVSTMSLNVTSSTFRPYFREENYKDNEIQWYVDLLAWIDENCLIEEVPEKLETVLKLEGESNSPFFQCMVDNIFLSQRENYILVTNDIFYLQAFTSIQIEFISMEYFFVNNTDSIKHNDFYKFLIKSKFIGLTIPVNLLIDFFYEKLSGKNNNFYTALESFSEWLNPYEGKINDLTKLFYEIYNIASQTLENLSLLIGNILSVVFKGSSASFRYNLRLQTSNKLHLLPQKQDSFLKIYKLIEIQMFKQFTK